jgi:hypothetical protein
MILDLFENDNVLRTKRLTRCRTVVFSRSIRLVCPLSLPTGRCRFAGSTHA